MPGGGQVREKGRQWRPYPGFSSRLCPLHRGGAIAGRGLPAGVDLSALHVVGKLAAVAPVQEVFRQFRREARAQVFIQLARRQPAAVLLEGVEAA